MLLMGATTYIPSDDSLLGLLKELSPGAKISVVRTDESELTTAPWKTFGYEAEYSARAHPSSSLYARRLIDRAVQFAEADVQRGRISVRSEDWAELCRLLTRPSPAGER